MELTGGIVVRWHWLNLAKWKSAVPWLEKALCLCLWKFYFSKIWDLFFPKACDNLRKYLYFIFYSNLKKKKKKCHLYMYLPKMDLILNCLSEKSILNIDILFFKVSHNIPAFLHEHWWTQYQLHINTYEWEIKKNV